MKESQIPCQKRLSPCGKIAIYVESDTPISAFHDFLLSEKGKAIDLMVKLQKDEEAMRDRKNELAKEDEDEDGCCKEEKAE